MHFSQKKTEVASDKNSQKEIAETQTTPLPVARPKLHAVDGDASASLPKNSAPAIEPMRLSKRILVSERWNNGEKAFGLDRPPPGKEGAWIGPAAVAYFRGNTYILDTANKRVLGYDKDGAVISSVSLPSNVASDLSVDASGSALIVVDHFNNKVYKIENKQATEIGMVSMKVDDIPLGTKFNFDPASNTLSPQNLEADGLVKIEDNNLTLGLGGDKKFTIPFDRPLAGVEEMITDSKGIIWVLYSLEGDYQMRRIARVDPARNTVGLAEIDCWFAFDATRHMAVTGNGVVVFAGDREEGRLVSFDYDGNGT